MAKILEPKLVDHGAFGGGKSEQDSYGIDSILYYNCVTVSFTAFSFLTEQFTRSSHPEYDDDADDTPWMKPDVFLSVHDGDTLISPTSSEGDDDVFFSGDDDSMQHSDGNSEYRYDNVDKEHNYGESISTNVSILFILDIF